MAPKLALTFFYTMLQSRLYFNEETAVCVLLEKRLRSAFAMHYKKIVNITFLAHTYTNGLHYRLLLYVGGKAEKTPRLLLLAVAKYCKEKHRTSDTHQNFTMVRIPLFARESQQASVLALLSSLPNILALYTS